MSVIADSLKRATGTTAIVVTSKAHTRRVRALWNHLEAGRGQIIVRAAKTDSFDAAHWWRSTHSALDVVREVLGLFQRLGRASTEADKVISWFSICYSIKQIAESASTAS